MLVTQNTEIVTPFADDHFKTGQHWSTESTNIQIKLKRVGT